MKYLIVFVSLLVSAYGMSPELMEAMKTHILQMAGECKTDVGVSDDDVAPLMVQNSPTTEKGKCFLACMHKKMGFQDADGKINKEGVNDKLEKIKEIDAEFYPKMKQVMDTCLDEVHDTDNECETALQFYVCVQKERTKAGIPPISFD